MTDDDVFRFIARHFGALVVAESIADFGFFPSEPLITVPEDDRFVLLKATDA
jgi:hypothetical protein